MTTINLYLENVFGGYIATCDEYPELMAEGETKKECVQRFQTNLSRYLLDNNISRGVFYIKAHDK